MSQINVSKALAETKALVTALEAFDGTDAQHLSLLGRTDSVRRALEQPYDAVTRWIENMSVAASVYTLIRIKTLENIPYKGSVSAIELAKRCNTDVSIITRAMRILIANGIAVETAANEYRQNSLSAAFKPNDLAGYVWLWVEYMKSWVALPDYISSHAPDDLYDLGKSPYAFATGHEGKTYYEVVGLDPEQRHLWNMGVAKMDKNFPVLGMFPFSSLESSVKQDLGRPFIVNISGGRGQELREIQKECDGGWGGKLILQDLPIVIDSLRDEDLHGIERMAYNFYDPQPVKNAHVYLIRRIIHDHLDPVCIKLLKNTASAMGPTSRLIICDMILPDRVEDGLMQLYWLDLCLVSMSGKIRTVGEFQNLFQRSGLELVQVYRSNLNNVAMLEARRKF
ncbi:O-methyltransferase-like protein [Durotheca rogersii]|uniref:O-methyltransferase-like protein n=1 Tax=Durotheca rogersii TaxID=419775 RepID=UPI00221F4351|nr:O-methyltransferase-like protein [Durotheca rogersii]KAI5863063.1 O-methyltransferase-like protein [Durotheca rogersii]